MAARRNIFPKIQSDQSGASSNRNIAQKVPNMVPGPFMNNATGFQSFPGQNFQQQFNRQNFPRKNRPQNSPQQYQLQRNPIICMYCNKPGHMEIDCFSKRKNLNQNQNLRGGERCSVCNIFGHVAVNCRNRPLENNPIKIETVEMEYQVETLSLSELGAIIVG